jgi:hypothetical protein
MFTTTGLIKRSYNPENQSDKSVQLFLPVCVYRTNKITNDILGQKWAMIFVVSTTEVVKIDKILIQNTN